MMGGGPGIGTSAVPWPHAAASFAAMWTAMMIVMMLPSLSPTLWRYRRALGAMRVARPTRQTAMLGAAYFGVWAALGLVLSVLGLMLTAAVVRWPSLTQVMPFAASAVVAGAGAMQLSRRKAHHLARCRDAVVPSGAPIAQRRAAWRDGVRLGEHCVMSCSGPTAVLLVLGMMDLRAMAIVTAAITAERTLPLPAGARVARITGAMALGAGAAMAIRIL